MIGICTDSNSQLPDILAHRYSVEVVPITIKIDDDEYLEGVDLDADRFYETINAEPRPQTSTTQPSSGQFAAAYESLLRRGCDEILSIHITAETSGTLNAARLAARSLSVPVRLVDSGTAGFGISCCVWAAADAIARGASLDEAVQIAETLSPHVGAVFVVGQLAFVSGDGRVSGPDGVPVVTIHNGQLQIAAHVTTVAEAIETMTTTATTWGKALKVGVGMADRSGEPMTQALVDAISASPNVAEVVRYRIGPSVGSYAGAGTVGCFAFPTE